MADVDDCSAAAAAVVPSELSSTGAEEVASAAELDLGLTLRTSKLIRGSRMACRILTAEDLGSRSPISSSSSVSSSSSAPSPAGAGGRTPPSHCHGQMARGWPPIKICRMNSLAIHSKDCTSEAETSVQKKIDKIVVKEDTDSNNQEKYIRCTVSTHFVKVNMDGDPIGRKVDLNAHNSYETLALALEDMFCKSNNDHDTFTYGLKASQMLDGSSGFSLTYEDRDGDWMLVGDVPWGMFLITVKRLRIMRTSDAIGLAGSPRSQFCKSVRPRIIPA
ncbi:auxin-responsive protein IAA10-like isoform X2 [Dioscorea cayenensis subsp. rotundata]|uniref:Auxin-responsive protein n=1 Tax=Dioscorea cayennensis subsp. rotundata TaxID=55577 RepID=A0AB40CHH3_DIOCR|nr:auxin-responsive protein IAA10-like isoform X2 [Dioscorea cayenensis subsp. rotundata]